jgi:tripartite-type tricarboxylate transporter receptor subunit TctC
VIALNCCANFASGICRPESTQRRAKLRVNISRNGRLLKRNDLYCQLALTLATSVDPQALIYRIDVYALWRFPDIEPNQKATKRERNMASTTMNNGGVFGRRLLWIMSVVVGWSLSNVAASAQSDYPSRTITIVVPFAPGGPTDASARIVANSLTPILGVRVIVENRAGAGNQVGMQYALSQPADGYTLIVTTQSSAVLGLVNKAFTTDLKKEVVGIAGIGQNSLVIGMNAKVPARDFAEFVKYAKDNPGALNYGSVGASDILANNAIKKAAGIEAVTVRYGGAGPMATGILANDVQYGVFFSGVLAPYVATGQLRAIATTGTQRHPDFPDLPTIKEFTKSDAEMISWVGLLAKTGTPQAIIDKLGVAMTQVLREPDVRNRLKTMGYEVMDMGPAAFTRYWNEEIDKWTKVAKETGFEPQ